MNRVAHRRTRALVGALAVAVVLAPALSGCGVGGESGEAFRERLAAEEGVASVIQAPRGGPGRKDPAAYAVLLRDDLDAAELGEVDDRLRPLVVERGDGVEHVSILWGGWQWTLMSDGRPRKQADLAQTVSLIAAASEMDGVFGGSAQARGDETFLEVVARAGVDPVALYGPVAALVEDAAPGTRATLRILDLPGRREISVPPPSSQDPFDPAADALVAAIDVAEASGDVLAYSVRSEGRPSFRMRTRAQAVAAAPALEAHAAAHGLRQPTVTGPVEVVEGADPAAADRISAVLETLDGVQGASVGQRGDYGQTLAVGTADVESALRVQEVLAAAPEMQAYAALELSTDAPDDTGRRVNDARRLVVALTPRSDANSLFDPALRLAQRDGVRSVVTAPFALDVELEPGADPVAVAADIKAAARPSQKVTITAAPFFTDDSIFGGEYAAFRVDDELDLDEVRGHGDREAFVNAWNRAEGGA
ncbi:hypothetical protein [Microbacterium resistens]